MSIDSKKIGKPKVSVLMPVYKTPENYLKEAIESILNQTFSNFEFLILDDCPTQSQKMRESTLKIHKLLIQEHTQRKINNACKKSQIAYIQAS